MKVTLNWLRDFVPVTLPPAELARRITLAGLEVKETRVTGSNWENVLVGQITDVQRHPNADRLTLVTIDLGTEKPTVVCGAPNVRAGDKIAFARVGAKLIDGHTGQLSTLKPAKIRGVVSSGMVCSEKELGISQNHEGILILPAGAPIGTALADYLGDVVFDLEVTPNRPDCLSVTGIAREVGALEGQRLSLPDVSYEEKGEPIDRQIAVEIVAPDLCPRYCATLITGIKVAPSPDWMQRRLQACGQRPINNMVDITNYVMLEYGQPLHAFNYHLIRGKKIIVRRANNGEVMPTLDGVARNLSNDMLVIADAEGAVAVAGIMGGVSSEVSEQTTAILLEAASFNPTSIHYTGSALGLPTEARTRFERGIRAELTMPAIKRATQLMAELGGGTVAKGIIDVYPGKIEHKPILLTTAKVKKVLGIEFTIDQIVGALTALGFECKSASSESVSVAVPWWRSDIRQPIDLVEEVARNIGYDRIPTTMLSQPIPRQDPSPMLSLQQAVRRSLVGLGFCETVTYSLTGSDMLSKLMPEGAESPSTLPLINPMTAEQAYLRPNLRVSLLPILEANRRHEDGPIKLFEQSRVYLPRVDDLPDERESVCGVLSGPRWAQSWQGSGGSIDFFDAKGIVEGLLNALGVDAVFEHGHDASLHPDKQVAIMVGGNQIGMVGELHPKTQAAFELAEPVYVFEIDLTALMPLTGKHKMFQPIPRFPAVVRDIALVVGIATTHQRVQSIITGFPLVAQVAIFDVYSGEQVPPGKKSLAYRITYQSPAQTLTDEEVDRVQQQLLDKLTKELGATLRG